jgi:hypothetical protein
MPYKCSRVTQLPDGVGGRLMVGELGVYQMKTDYLDNAVTLLQPGGSLRNCVVARKMRRGRWLTVGGIGGWCTVAPASRNQLREMTEERKREGRNRR